MIILQFNDDHLWKEPSDGELTENLPLHALYINHEEVHRVGGRAFGKSEYVGEGQLLGGDGLAVMVSAGPVGAVLEFQESGVARGDLATNGEGDLLHEANRISIEAYHTCSSMLLVV